MRAPQGERPPRVPAWLARTALGVLVMAVVHPSGARAVVSGQCVQALGGNSCTAGDVTFVLVGLGTQTTGCVNNSGDVTMFLGATLRNTAANNRYDVGMFINTDGSGSALTGTTCARQDLTPLGTQNVTTCPPLDLADGSGPYLNLNGNGCGDLAKTGTLTSCSGGGGDSFFVFPTAITFPCADLNPRTGFIQIPTCATWANSAGEITCNSESDLKPGTGSKCNCAVIQSNVPNPNLGLSCSCSPTPVRPGASTACTVSFTNAFSPACTNPTPTPAERFQCGVASYVRFKALYSTANGGAVLDDGSVTPSETTGGTVADDGNGTVTWTPRDTTASGTSLGIVGANETGSMTYQYIVGATQPDGVVNQTVETFWSNGATFSPEVQATALSTTCTFTVSSTASWASVHGVKAHEEAGRVVLEWETAAEIGTAGFRVLRRDERSGELRAVSGRLLPASGQAAGGVYRFVDETAPTSGRLTYKIVERELKGGVREHGPFTVEVQHGPAGQAPQVVAAGFHAEPHRPSETVAAATRAAAGAPVSLAAAGGSNAATRLKLLTGATGLYTVRAADLAAAFGGSPASAAAQIAQHHYRLGNRGADVAWTPAADGQGVVFYAAPVDPSVSLYNLQNVYWLDNGGSGVAIAAAAGGAATAPAPQGQSFQDTQHFKQSVFANPYVTSDPTSDYWFWQSFISGDPQIGQGSFAVALAGVPAPGAGAALTVNLMGFSSSHRVTVELNGSAVGEVDWTWDGTGFGARYSATLPLAPGQLVAGANRIDLVGLDGIFFLDSFDVTYQRLYVAAGDQLALRGEANAVVTVTGFSRSDIAVYDLSTPQLPKAVAVLIGADPAGGYRVSFLPGSPATPYLAASGAAITAAAATARTDAGLASSHNGAADLIITAASLRAAAQTLATYRSSRGVVSQVVTVDDIMDDFAYGLLDPAAMRQFLAYAAASWQPSPHYVTLAGKGSYDYRNLLGFGDDLVPPMMVASYEGLVPSDGALADLDGDGIPDLAIGRIPALTAAELAAYVNKVQVYEGGASGTWSQQVLMVADAPDAAGNYAQGSDAVASRLPAGLQVDRDYLPAGADTQQIAAARTQLLGDFDSGRVVVNYVGHGGLDRLSSAGLLTLDDVGQLTGGARSPVLTALTCNIANFAYPGYRFLGEELVVQPGGGAMAVYAPSGLSYDGPAVQLGEQLLPSLLGAQGSVLGDAVLQGVGAYARSGGDRTLLPVFNLLGDPLLAVR